MANTFTSLHYHVVFSVKNRQPLLSAAIEERVWAYMGGIAKENKMTPVCIGGFDDHVHLLLGLSATCSVSEALRLIKGASSKWIGETFPGMGQFNWQDGYGAFTIGMSQIDGTVRYIRGQREHHRIKSFQEEYLAFLEKHRVQYDPKYVFG
jgi:putative transposase